MNSGGKEYIRNLILREYTIMQDLINEEEFIPKKSNYNPWKSFGVFYIVASVIAISYCIFLKFFNPSEPNGFVLFFMVSILPVILALIMIFRKKENISLCKKTIALSVVLLIGIYCFLLLFMITINKGMQMFEQDYIITFPIFLGIIIILSIITLAIVLPVKFYKERKNKKLK